MFLMGLACLIDKVRESKKPKAEGSGAKTPSHLQVISKT
jgi:hypothetical protein